MTVNIELAEKIGDRGAERNERRRKKRTKLSHEVSLFSFAFFVSFGSN
jgi:hypothetical protein